MARSKALFRWMGLFCLGLCLVLGAGTARAHNETVDFGGISLNGEGSIIHNDAAGYKGWIDLTVTNTGDTAWGDFHFEIFQSDSSGEPVNNVFFDVSADAGYTPEKNYTDLTNFTLRDGGQALDLFFYSDPVDGDEDVSFRVFTDNTIDEISQFGVSFYPTPVPLPTPILLMGSGLICAFGFRRWLPARHDLS